MCAPFWYNMDTTYMREYSCGIALIKAFAWIKKCAKGIQEESKYRTAMFYHSLLKLSDLFTIRHDFCVVLRGLPAVFLQGTASKQPCSYRQLYLVGIL